MINIDLKEFFRHRYWFSLYYWCVCHKHKHYKSSCGMCNQGVWYFHMPGKPLQKPREDWFLDQYKRFKYSFGWKMDMNSVRWPGQA